MTILYTLLIFLVAVLVTTITSLYDLTIYSYSFEWKTKIFANQILTPHKINYDTLNL